MSASANFSFRRAGQARLGVLGFIALTLVVLAALVVFAKYPSIFRHGREYRAVFSDVAGLNAGDEVRYGGLSVGYVTRMQISPKDPTKIEVYFRVRGSTPVSIDTRASITQVGLLGEQYLLLQPGSRTAPLLAAGGTLPSEQNLSFQNAMTRLALFFDRADTLLIVAERLTRTNPVDKLDSTLERMDTLAAVATRGSARAFADVDQATARVDQLLDRSAHTLALLDTTVSRAAPQLTTTETQAVQTVQDLRALLADLRDGLQQGGGLSNLVRNANLASENLARLTERLDRDPSTILDRRTNPPKPAGPAVR